MRADRSATPLTNPVRFALLPPAALGLLLCTVAGCTLYSNAGHPSRAVRPPVRSWAKICLLTFGSLCTVGYVIVEQIFGWEVIWLPRGLEGTSPSWSKLDRD